MIAPTAGPLHQLARHCAQMAASLRLEWLHLCANTDAALPVVALPVVVGRHDCETSKQGLVPVGPWLLLYHETFRGFEWSTFQGDHLSNQLPQFIRCSTRG